MMKSVYQLKISLVTAGVILISITLTYQVHPQHLSHEDLCRQLMEDLIHSNMLKHYHHSEVLVLTWHDHLQFILSL